MHLIGAAIIQGRVEPFGVVEILYVRDHLGSCSVLIGDWIPVEALGLEEAKKALC